MATTFTNGRFFDHRAVGLSPGAALYSYAAGTLTPLDTYTDQGGGSANANPKICDVNGGADVWLGASGYKLRLYTDTIANGGTLIDEWDNISGPVTTVDLASTASASLGAGLLGFNSSLEYPADYIGAVPYFINVREFGALRGNSNAANKTALQDAIAAANSRGRYAVIVVPPDIGYGYSVTSSSTWPSFSGVVVPITILDHSPGASYAGYPTAYDGAQFRCWYHTPQTTSPGQHDGNGQWLRAAWNPYLFLSNDSNLAGVGDPSRTANDSRRASIFFGVDGVATWKVAQGSASSAALTDDELSNFTISAFNSYGGGSHPDGTSAMLIDRATGNFGFNTDPAESYHFKSRVAGYNQGIFESLGTTSAIGLRNSNGSGDDVLVNNVSGALKVSVGGSNQFSLTKANGYAGFGKDAVFRIDATDSRATNFVAAIENTSATDGYVLKLTSGSAQASTWTFIDAYSSGASLRFQVQGTGDVKNANNSYGAISDAKLKSVIGPQGSQWEDVKFLAGALKKYTLKDDETQRVQLGWVAQEIEGQCPGLVSEDEDFFAPRDGGERVSLGTTTKSVRYSVANLKAIKALGEAMERIEALEAEVQALRGA